MALSRYHVQNVPANTITKPTPQRKADRQGGIDTPPVLSWDSGPYFPTAQSSTLNTENISPCPLRGSFPNVSHRALCPESRLLSIHSP